MRTDSLRHKLGVAAAALLAAGADSPAHAQTADREWELDTSVLSYSESDDRVSVVKTLVNLEKQGNNSSWQVDLVNDTMSGASPTGAIRSSDSTATITQASGNSSDNSISSFSDTRRQAGIAYSRGLSDRLELGLGGAVSRESDFDSVGANVDVSIESFDRLTTYSVGLASTSDTIYRSDTLSTPQPLGNVQNSIPYSKGNRSSIDTVFGLTRALNKQTLFQVNLTLSQSNGYHSDPYKIISAADENNQIAANFHDSRPESRQRTAFSSKLVHQLGDTKDSVRLSYRWYQDDWGITSNTLDFRYRKLLQPRHYIEPHVRFYLQQQADFYRRKLDVDNDGSPLIPADRIASSDYRLDKLSSATLGLKYGFSISRRSQLRLKLEYLTQRYATAEYDTLSAVIFQSSLNFRF